MAALALCKKIIYKIAKLPFLTLTAYRYSLLRNEGRVDILDLINGVLGSLVSITAGCFLYHAWEAILIGMIGALLACITMPMFDRLGVDDPVGASSVHGVCGIWGKSNLLYH